MLGREKILKSGNKGEIKWRIEAINFYQDRPPKKDCKGNKLKKFYFKK